MTSNTFEQRYKSVPKSSFDMNNIDKFKSSSKLIHILIAWRSEIIDEISFIIITEDFDNEKLNLYENLIIFERINYSIKVKIHGLIIKHYLRIFFAYTDVFHLTKIY